MTRIPRSMVVFAALSVSSAAFAGDGLYDVFSSISRPIGVSCVGDGPNGIDDKLIVTTYTGQVYTVDETGAATQQTPIAGLPGWSSVEVYVAVSPGLGNWAVGTTYLARGGTIYQLADDFSSATPFATIAGTPSTHTSITFDRTGVWNYDMIVSFRDGRVFRIDDTGTATFVASTGVLQEGVRVLPDDRVKWPTYAGCISTSSESVHTVYAICPDSSVNTIANGVINAESSDVRPGASSLTTFGTTDYVYFLSAFNNAQVVAYTDADLPAGSEGELFVAREFSGGIYNIDETSVSVFSAALNEHYEGSNFCFKAGAIDTSEDCENGIDDDGDGDVDGDDTDCHVCGDGDLDPGEECDDGNVVDGDSCDSSCNAECPTAGDLGVGRYNAYVCNDFTSHGSDSQGAMAIGGNATLSGYGIASQGAYGGTGLTVGHNLDGTSSQVYHGDAYAGTCNPDTDSDPSFNVLGGSLTCGAADAGADCTDICDVADHMAGLASQHCTVTASAWGGVSVDVTGTEAVCEFDTDAIANAFAPFVANGWINTLNINGNGHNPSTVIINVTGSQAIWAKNGGFNLHGVSAASVVWNFGCNNALCSTSGYEISNVGVKGSLMAPDCDLTFNNGHIDGQYVVGSHTGNGQLHDFVFSGDICITGDTPTGDNDNY